MTEEMLSIRVRDVRPQVEVGQETVQLPEIESLSPCSGGGGAVDAWGLRRPRP